MTKKDKHIKIPESIISVIDDYAEKTRRNKTVAYEIALRSFIENNKEELIKSGVSKKLIEQAVGL